MGSQIFWRLIANAKPLRTLVPSWLRSFIRRHWSVLDYDKYMCAKADPFSDKKPFSTYESKTPFTLGIIKEFAHFHSHYIAACRELKVSYKLVDISVNDWLSVVQESECDAFLVWPSPKLSIWKEMYEERLRIMTEDLDKIVYPSYNEIWLYESKRRMRDWLLAHNIPHPKTWIFYDLEQATDFIDEAERHAELYGTYSTRQEHVLEIIKKTTRKFRNDTGIRSSLLKDGVTDSEILWLMRNGHYLPVYA